jgi:hypothetical protein
MLLAGHYSSTSEAEDAANAINYVVEQRPSAAPIAKMWQRQLSAS